MSDGKRRSRGESDQKYVLKIFIRFGRDFKIFENCTNCTKSDTRAVRGALRAARGAQVNRGQLEKSPKTVARNFQKFTNPPKSGALITFPESKIMFVNVMTLKRPKIVCSS